MSIKVDRIENTSITYKQVIDLIHESFEERLGQGLKFTCSSLTESQFRNNTKNAIVFVAIDTDTDLLAGTASIQINAENRSSYLEYVAVCERYKHTGVASQIFYDSIVPLVKYSCCEYIISDTATKAESSVKWHKKQGFKIVGLVSFESTNYYSYIFRKQLIRPSIWNCNLCTSFIFQLNKVRTKLTRTASGQYTAVGRLLAKFRNIS